MRRRMSFLLTITLAAVGAVAVIAGPADAGPGARAANFTPPPLPPPMLTANARFEAARFSGEISAWACDNRTAPVPTGHPERGWVLSGSPTATAASGCAQPIPVTPNSSYWLTFASRGGPVEVVAGEHRATAPASREWAWTRMEFTTGPTTTDLLLSVRGVPGGGAFMADDIVLQGSASPDHVPATPTGVVISERTSSSFQVAWTGSPGTTQYLVYVRTPDGELYAVGTRYMSTDALERSRVEFLEPDTAYDVTVTALGPAGVSAPSASVAARTVAASAAPPPRVRSVAARPAFGTYIKVTWAPAAGATDGYTLQRETDGYTVSVRAYAPEAFVYVGEPTGERHTFRVVALNSAGESPPSRPVTITY